MVSRDQVYWCLRRRGVPEKLVRLVEASTVVRTTHGRTYDFPTKVGLHQGSGLSPFLFIVVLDVISEDFRCGLPCELLLEANIKDSQGTSLRQVNKFKYLGVTISDGGSEEAVRARVSAAWGKWRDLSGVISDKK